MDGLIVSTTQLVSASDTRKKLGPMLDTLSSDPGSYFVILQNGKLAGLLVHPDLLKEKGDLPSLDLEKLRAHWGRYKKPIHDALDHLDAIDSKDLPLLLQ